ncbi:hypothetical protein [Paenibacillus sp. BC26]|uniref:hypothetical protein n=1 Tax=Paenibacillus sp. BC26 TaxID=1881032 RepID=UPI0008EAC9E5|nr:hypothetical protein [Paenibacillus sp. BC26]SFS72683.1 hypothetical protein SAMN05428962_2494 [Paenibacillus sp. BC26]
MLFWLVLLCGYYGKVFVQEQKVERNTAQFLDNIQSKNFSKAEELFGSPIDLEGMRNLQDNKGFWLEAYNHIKAEYDDGCVCTGQAELTFHAHGKSIDVSAVFSVGKGNKVGQICAITPPGVKRGSIPELSEWNLIACGSDSF